jgi:hypothetical protein
VKRNSRLGALTGDGLFVGAVVERRADLVLPPREYPVDLNIERKAQESSYNHNESEHADVLERRLDRDGADEVSRNEDLQCERRMPRPNTSRPRR